MSCESGTGGVAWSFEFPATVRAVGTVGVLSLFPLFSGGALVGDSDIVYLLKVPKRYKEGARFTKNIFWNDFMLLFL